MAFTRTWDAAGIVCVGVFNPAIFQPEWLAARGLIQRTEAEGAEIRVITPDVAEFKIKWAQLQVIRERLTAGTETPDDFPLLRDLVVGAFQLLEHTPITAVGLNRQMHFRVEDPAAWHHIGHVFAPKAIWRRHMKNPGLKLLTIKAQRPDDLSGEININVNPVMVATTSNTVEVFVNSHLDVRHTPTAGAVSKLMAEQWERTMDFASELGTRLITDALNEKEPRE